MKFGSILSAGILACALSAAVHANPAPVTTVTKPTSDGSLYVCDGCVGVSDGDYLLAAGYIEGDVKFSTAGLRGHPSEVTLTLNPYGEPLWGKDVQIYGYSTSIAALDLSDRDAGTFLGTLVLPDNLGFGQDASFDVTSFVDSVTSRYVGFILRTTDVDVFSSLEFNYGHPSELLAVGAMPVPEPSTNLLMLTGAIAAMAGLRSRRRRVG